MRRARSSLALVGAAAVLALGGGRREAFAVSGAVQNPANGHWYLRVTSATRITRSGAEAAVAAAGGYLATFTSDAEWQWAGSAIMSGAPFTYLGGSDASAEGTWQWVTGETWSYAPWAPGEPNNALGGTQDYLQSGGMFGLTWDDCDDGTVNPVYGYVIEWDSDPNGPPPPPPTPPTAPMSLAASYSAGTGVTLTWIDTSSDETGFRVERHPAGFAFATRAETPAGATSFADFVLYPSANYTYRVAAFNNAGTSEYSNEASVSIPASVPLPPPPRAPTALTAAPDVDGGGHPLVGLAWTDNSLDETYFEVERARGGAGFGRAALEAADVTATADSALHPGWPHTYRVRALSLQGPSPWSDSVGVTPAATLDLAVTSGSLTDSTKRAKDKLKVSATFAAAAGSPAPAPDLVAGGVELQLGPVNAPIAVSIAPGDPAWKVKSRKRAPVMATWKSARGVSPAVKVVVDLVRHVLTATVAGADFAAPPEAASRLLLSTGADGGAHTQVWTERKPGSWRFTAPK